MTIKKLKSIDIINVLSDLVSEKLETTVKLPVEKAAHIALETVSQFLKEHTNDFDLVEWVLFDSHTQSVYEAELKKFM